MIIKRKDITMLKMSTNPPKCVVAADGCVICDGMVSQWVGIGWIKVREATKADYENIPQVLIPHCSQCQYYDNIETTMYCNKFKKRITARKKPCTYYDER